VLSTFLSTQHTSIEEVTSNSNPRSACIVHLSATSEYRDAISANEHIIGPDIFIYASGRQRLHCVI
jgi:hypothetical protein